MANQEASRSKYIIAFIVANFASNIAAKLGDLIFSASDYFNSAIRTGEVEQALFASSAISGLLGVGAWISVFLMFKNIYFQRMLWYVIAGNVIVVLVGFSTFSQMQDFLGLTDTFLLQSAFLSFAIGMIVPLFFYGSREDRYYPPVFVTRNEGVPSEVGPKTATTNLSVSNSQYETSLAKPIYEPTKTTSLHDIEASSEVPSDVKKIETYQYDKARKVIEYSEEAERYWSYIQVLPENYQNRFLEALNDDPLTDPKALAKRLVEENQSELRPYENEEANDLLERSRTISEAAASEFMEIYELLGNKADLNYAFAKIEAKFNAERLAEDAKRMRIERQKAERNASLWAATAAEHHHREAKRPAKGKPK